MHSNESVALVKVRMLESLSPDEIAQLSRQCIWRTFSPGECVVSAQSKDRHVHFIVRGCVRVAVYSGGGKVVSFRDMMAGETFGEIAAIDGLPRSANVEALEACTIASLAPTPFLSLMASNASILTHVTQQLAALVRSLSERLFLLSTLGIQNRVHAEILRLAKEAGVARNRAVVEPAPRHVEIANRISTNREQVTKELSAMSRQGLVEKQGRALMIPDVARLEKIVSQVLRTV